jgi:DNA repair protein RadC
MYTVQKYKLSYVREPDTAATRESRQINTRLDVVDFCKKYLADMPVENCCIIALNSGNKILGFTVFEGTTNQAAVYPGNVFRFLLSAGAVAFIVAHNHPGGIGYPSESDWNLTNKLRCGGELLDIALLDHLIISDGNSVSLREMSRWGK